MRGIICYDFSDDKARSRLVKILQKYGTRVQYSVFEFRLDKVTWQKLIQNLHEKKFLTGNHNIIIIPISDVDHNKIIYLGNVFMSFDYDTLICSSMGITGVGEKNIKLRTAKKSFDKKEKPTEITIVEQNILDKIFKKIDN